LWNGGSSDNIVTRLVILPVLSVCLFQKALFYYTLTENRKFWRKIIH